MVSFLGGVPKNSGASAVRLGEKETEKINI